MSDDRSIIPFSDKKNTRKKAADKTPAEYGPGNAFTENEGGFALNKYSEKYGKTIKQLTDWTATIIDVKTKNDGITETRYLTLEGTRADGKKLPAREISIEQFYSSSGMPFYHRLWGTDVAVFPGVKADILAQAVHGKSVMNGDIPKTQCFKTFGIHSINGIKHVLHAGGGIHAGGNNPDIKTELDGVFQKFILPDPQDNLSDPKFKKLIVQILKISKKHPYIGAVMFAFMARAVLNAFLHCSFPLWITGVTGSKKTTLAVIMLNFCGNFDSNTMPASWADTANSIEMKGFLLQCFLYLIDDFTKNSLQEGRVLQGKAEGVIRPLSQASGRGRLDQYSNTKPTAFIRAATIITSEDSPPGHSLNARCLHVPVEIDSVDMTTLNEVQAALREGLLPIIGASWIMWVLKNHDAIKTDFPNQVIKTRDEIIGKNFATSHPRAPDMLANLSVAFSLFLDFMTDTKIIESEERAAIEKDHKKALVALFKRQADYVNVQDEVIQFIDLLSASLSSGRSHIADAKTGGIPDHNSHELGWRRDQLTSHENNEIMQGRLVRPNGACIGWLSGDYIFIDPAAAFAEAQKLAQTQGTSLGMSDHTLWRRIMERGLLKAKEGDRPTVKRAIGSSQKRVLVFDKNIFDAND